MGWVQEVCLSYHLGFLSVDSKTTFHKTVTPPWPDPYTTHDVLTRYLRYLWEPYVCRPHLWCSPLGLLLVGQVQLARHCSPVDASDLERRPNPQPLRWIGRSPAERDCRASPWNRPAMWWCRTLLMNCCSPFQTVHKKKQGSTVNSLI